MSGRRGAALPGLEDFRVDVVVGMVWRDPDPLGSPVHPVGATTRPDCCGPYGTASIHRPTGLYDARISSNRARSAELRGVQLEDQARSSRRRSAPPRISTLRRRVREFAQVRADGRITKAVARRRRPVRGGELGLDGWTAGTRGHLPQVRRRAVDCRLAISVGEERETVEEVAEPFLVRQGFLMRTPRGRVATAAAWQHLGLSVPPALAGSDANPDLFG